MKRMILVLLSAAVLLTGCSLFGNSDSSSSQPDSSSTPDSSSAPTSSQQDSSSVPDSSSPDVTPTPESTPAPQTPTQDVSAWVGSYTKDPGSAGQIALEITAGSSAGTVHLVLDAKGRTFEGDALVYQEGDALCESLGNLTLHLERSGITVTEGQPLSNSASFSGFYQK